MKSACLVCLSMFLPTVDSEKHLYAAHETGGPGET